MDKKNQKKRQVKKRKQGKKTLRANEVRHQAILELALDAIISVDREGRIIEFNKAAETIFGHAKKNAIGKEMATLIIPPALRERHRASWERHLATGTTSIICKRIEIIAMRAGGAEFPVELIVTRHGPDGTPTFTAFIRDITERQQAEESLKLFRVLLDQVRDSIEVIDSQTGRFLDGNEKAWSNLGYARNELLSLTVPDIDPLVTRTVFTSIMQRLRETGKTLLQDSIHLRKDGTTFPVEVSAQLVQHDKEKEYLVAIVRDITERKQVEEERTRLLKEVQDSHERLQHLSRRMLEVQEEERRRLARDLHDQTGQSLTSLLIGLRILEEMPTLAEAQAQAGALRKITTDTLKEVKRLAAGLRPALLDELGLEAALKRLTKESASTYGVSVDLHIKGLPTHRLPLPMEMGLYRIAQEALTNTGQHATAKHASVLLTCSESTVKLIIEDDGRGFDVEKAQRLPGSSKHLGLLGMHERVALLNGTISVESTSGSRTAIYVQLPLEARPS